MGRTLGLGGALVRGSVYKPLFSEDDIQIARKICRSRNAPYVQVQRAQLALYLHQHPHAYSSQAAAALGLHEQTVRKWRRRWAVEGFSLVDRPRPGRPRRLPSPEPTQAGP